MEWLLGIVGVVLAIAWFFLPFAHISSIRGLRADVSDLRRRMERLEGSTAYLRRRVERLEGGAPHEMPSEPMPEDVPLPAAPPVTAWTERQVDDGHKEDARAAVVAARIRNEEKAYQNAPTQTKAQGRLEFNLTARLPVWIGAVALACAGFYLVRYSLEAGWLSPAVRVVGGGLFGAILTLAGDRVGRANRISNATMVAQGLVGAGLAALYGAFYAAVSVYHFLPPAAGVACMTAVTMGAVVMALRHGQPIAVFGLAAGILTPALVGSDTPQAMLLFGHVFIVFGFGMVVLARKGWWVLAAAVLAGMYGWCALWAVNGGGEERTLVLFAMGLAGVVAWATARSRETAALVLNGAAIAGAALLIAMVNASVPLGTFEWGMTIILSAGLLVLTAVREESYRGLLLCKAALDIAVLYMWGQDADAAGVMALLAVFAALYMGVPQVMMRRARDARFWALAQGGAAAGLYAVAHECVPDVSDMAWGAIALAMAAMAAVRARSYMRGEDDVSEHMTAIYTAGAVGFTATALAEMVPGDVLAATLAVKAAILLWLHGRTQIAALAPLALAVVAGVFVASLQPVAEIMELSADMGALRLFDGALVLDFLLPGVALLAGAMIYGGESRAVRHVQYGFGLLLLAGFAYYAAQAVPVTPFSSGGLFGAVMALGGIALVRRGDAARDWGRFVIGFVVARSVYLDLFMANPYFTSTIDVGGHVLLNGVTLVYGLGLVLCLYAMRIEQGRGPRDLYAAASFAMLFALVSLSVRQAAQGGVLAEGPMAPFELYSYSAAWLLTGIALLAAGIKTGSRAAHVAAGLFVALAVGKVFLFDAAELDGLYRVFSFLGLGLCLMGLSVFYTRYAKKRG